MSEYPSPPRIPMVDPASRRGRLVGLAANELRWKYDDPRVVVGRGTYGAPTIIHYSNDPNDRVMIGNYCSIALGATFIVGGQHHTGLVSTFPFDWYYSQVSEALEPPVVAQGSITIGSDVWIGFGATLLSGITVGHGAIIGAKAVVASNVAPYSIVVGNPAKVLRLRLPEPVVERMLAVRWWDWQQARVRQYQPLIQGDPQAFLAELDRLGESTWRGFAGEPASSDRMDFVPESLAQHWKRTLKRMFR